jgi:serine/threonine protein kinase
MPSRSDPAEIDELTAQLRQRFTVTATVRGGGQGMVYRATRHRDPQGDAAADDVALKLYNDAAQVARIDREVNAMSRVRHKTLANLIEHGYVVLGGRTLRYVACDYIDGEALDRRLRIPPPIQPAVVAVVGRDVATAIGEIWRERIVHRDVSPKNIMLRVGEREAVLIDLGIARHTAEDTITSFGTAWGTLGYMSPEQERADHQLTALSDVFSLGVVLQECLAGRHPTGGDQRALSRGAPATADLARNAPAGLAQLVDQMLHPRPSFRPSDPGLLAEQFAEFVPAIQHP